MSRMAPFSILLIIVSWVTAAVSETPEERTARYLDSVRNHPSLLLAFLEQMPKGGDLHNHMSGGKRFGCCDRRRDFRALRPPVARSFSTPAKRRASSGHWKKNLPGLKQNSEKDGLWLIADCQWLVASSFSRILHVD